MFLSVIVPTRNRAKLLERALESFAAQRYPRDRYEVIVVDNGSTDETADVVTAQTGSVPNLSRIWEPRPGLHRGRHAGLEAARGEVLVYADDDIRAAPTWLESIAAAFADPQVALVGGPCVPDFEHEPPRWIERLWHSCAQGRYLTLFSVVELGDEIATMPSWLVFGCNFSIRRAALRAVGGFHPDGMPGDLIRFRGDGETAVSKGIDARGLRTLYHPGAAVHHWVSAERLSERYVYQRSYAQGVSESYSRVRAARKAGFDAWMLARLAARFLVFRARSLLRRDGQVERAQERGYRLGYLFHQRALREDPALLPWVLKPDYLED